MQRDSPCRESRPVPFYENASIWKAVEAGVIVSADVDENMCFNPPVRAEKKLAFQMQRKPLLRSPSHVRLPTRLPPIEGVHVRLLAAELSSAEAEIAALRKHVNTQNRVIDGLCRLRVTK